MTTSIRLGRQAEQPVRLDDLEPLVHQRRRVDRDLPPHPPGRMLQRLVRRHVLERLDRLAAERTAGRGQDEPRDLVAAVGRAGTGGSALCSLSTGSTATPRRRAASMTRAPAITSTSLFASAMVLPASMAASTASRAVGARRGAQHDVGVGVRGDGDRALGSPGVARRVARTAPLSSQPFGPLGRRQRGKGRAVARDLVGERARRCRPAASATTRSRSGCASTTESALCPIEPVEPRMAMRLNASPAIGGTSAPAHDR